MILFNFGRANHLDLSRVVDDDDYTRVVGLWLNGRICGRYLSVHLPWWGRL